MGFKTTEALLEKVKIQCAENKSQNKSFTESDFKELLKKELENILKSPQDSLAEDISTLQISEIFGKDNLSRSKPYVILVVGVNGAGKTTTIGKLSSKLISDGNKVLLGGCDTFRAAAGEQLAMWASRGGAEIEKSKSIEESSQHDSAEKPSTVAFRAVQRAKEENFDVLIIDTAGRLHTKHNLMRELGAVKELITRELPGAPHEVLLVLDATSGQNAIQQAKEFNELAKLSGLIITKLDGTAKGGVLVAVRSELPKVPIRFVGVGEGIEDLRNFSTQEFISGLLDTKEGEFLKENTAVEEVAPLSEHGKKRARRKRRTV